MTFNDKCKLLTKQFKELDKKGVRPKMKCLICDRETTNDDSLCSDDCRIEMAQEK